MAVIGGNINRLTGRPRLPVFSYGVTLSPFLGAVESMDFAGTRNGGVPYYSLNGTQVADAAAVGFVGNGTFNSAGYTAVGTQLISKSVALTGDFMIFCQFVQPPIGALRELWLHNGGAQVFRASGGTYSSSPAGGSPASATRVTIARSGGVSKVSFDNGAVVTGGAFTPGTDTLYIGNEPGGTAPWTVAIENWTRFNGTFSDAQIQALGT